MPIHDFSFNAPGPANLQGAGPDSTRYMPKTSDPAGAIETLPLVPVKLPEAPTTEVADDLFFENLNVDKSFEIKELLPQGFRTIDRGVKNWLSGIRIPTNNGVRMMSVRIAGGNKTVLFWTQDLKGGRVTLPVMSINRTAVSYFPDKFSPPHHFMSKRFIGSSGDHAMLTFRPVPFLVDYTLSIWTEHKRDAEYANYQIITRFNPLAEFIVEDEHLRGSVQVRFNGWSDSSDKEADPETRANVRYDLEMVCESWLPLPEKKVPTILGRVTTLREDTGVFLENASGMTQVRISGRR